MTVELTDEKFIEMRDGKRGQMEILQRQLADESTIPNEF